MKPLRRVFTLSLLLLSLTACIDLTDPYDRIQGEPSEEGVAATATDESGPAEAPAAPNEPAGEAEEGH